MEETLNRFRLLRHLYRPVPLRRSALFTSDTLKYIKSRTWIEPELVGGTRELSRLSSYPITIQRWITSLFFINRLFHWRRYECCLTGGRLKESWSRVYTLCLPLTFPSDASFPRTETARHAQWLPTFSINVCWFFWFDFCHFACHESISRNSNINLIFNFDNIPFRKIKNQPNLQDYFQKDLTYFAGADIFGKIAHTI